MSSDESVASESSMEELFGGLEEDDFAELARMMQAGIGATFPVGHLVDEHKKLVSKFADFDPLRTTGSFGALLTHPDLNSNNLRLESLVHLALVSCRGDRKPHDKLIAEAYAAMGAGAAGMMEDPAENVLVGLVSTSRGNFRVLNGIWETPAYYLQRMVDVLEAMPASGFYAELRNNIFALLALSDLVCERAGLERYQLGNELKTDPLPLAIRNRLSSLRNHIHFEVEELEAAGIPPQHLSAFFFDPSHTPKLLGEEVGHSTLERYPIACRRGHLWLLLPTAVSVAIRRLIIERLEATGQRDALVTGIARGYSRTLGRTRLLGSTIRTRVVFARAKEGAFGGAILRADRGRYLNLVFVLDTLEKFAETGFVTPHVRSKEWGEELEAWIKGGREEAEKEPDFQSGITLIVTCGVGRATAIGLTQETPPGWRLHHVSAPDFDTLSSLSDMSPPFLWRLFDAQHRLEEAGVTLENVNGLLNLVAWNRTLDGHMVPHAQIPDDFVAGSGRMFVMVDQNGLRKLRHEVLVERDEHVELTTEGRWRLVRKSADSFFEEDRTLPLYLATDNEPGKRGIPSVYLTEKRPWWCEIEAVDEASAYYAAERWKMATTWLQRAAPVLEKRFSSLPDGPILWVSKFIGALDEIEIDGQPSSFEQARAAVVATSDREARRIALEVDASFQRAIFNVDNIAERAFVDGLVEGVSMLAGEPLGGDARKDIVDQITGGTAARQSHAFARVTFRDRVADSVPANPVIIERIDDATERLGLGWRVRDAAAGPTVKGKAECTAYINAVVRWLEDDLCARLREFNRESLIRFALRNHESACVDRDRWKRTAAAVLALHDDKAAARQTMAEHDFKLNAVFQSNRLLVEFAIAECPVNGGRVPGELDLARLMATTAQLLHIGGWSDAIRWDAMEPTLRVTPFGDVHANWEFLDNVVQPFARSANDARVDDAVENYAQNLEERPFSATIEDAFDPRFVAAWNEQTGATMDQFRLFIDCMEDLALAEDELVVVTKRSRIFSAESDGQKLPPEVAATITSFLTFAPRAKWRDVPAGYDVKDRQPWRFRRRLSVLRKPLVQIDDADDPTIIVAPGIVRDAFMYMFGNYHRGDFADEQLSPKMRAWKARISDKRGAEFTKEVSDKLRELGWQTDTELKVTKLLRQGFDRDYGDVDVLAWKPESGRVLAIECKDVQYRKTAGEVAEQLADFRGETDDKGKRDQLRRHLDRMELLANHLPAVASYVSMDTLSTVESHLVFRNPVPMEFALKHMSERVRVSTYDKLGQL